MPTGRDGNTVRRMNTSTSAARVGTGDRLFTGSFVLLTAAELAYFTAAGIAIYALPLFVTGPVGSDIAGAGIAFGAFAVSALLLRPFAGRLSDTWGRRPLLITGAVVCAVSMTLTAHAETLTAVVTLRLVLGVAEAAFFVAAIAALADLAPPSRIGEAMSINSLGLYLGLAFGPPLGEVLVKTAGFTAAWFAAGALSMIAAIVVLPLGETRSPQTDRGAPAPLIHWATVPLAAGFFTSVVAIGGFLAFAALHADAVGLPNPSIPLITYGIVVVVCRVLFAKVPDRVPALPLGASALGIIAAGLIVTAVWATPVGMLAAAVMLGVGVAFSTPAFFTAIFTTTKPSERGAASGTASAFLDLGIGGGPIMLGFVAQSAGIPWAFGVGAAVAAMGSIWTLSLTRTHRGSP
jgi:predicted MFS family arabinose efflux permease